MLRHNKRSGLYVVPCLIVVAGLLVSSLYPVAQAGPGPSDEGTESGLWIGPVAGLTTTWHSAPSETSIPLGTMVEFKVGAPPEAEVTWTGAGEVRRDQNWSYALCPLREVGTANVSALVVISGVEQGYGSVLDVVDVSPQQIQLGPIAATVAPVDLHDYSSNHATMYYYFTPESIAALNRVGMGQYRTSVDREVQMALQVNPSGFAPLIEWRVDGDPVALGSSMEWSHWQIGVYSFSAGPSANPREAQIETYRVTITSPAEGETIPEGEPVTFTAITHPPGYEDEITWLSSTKFGRAMPILGQGPSFTVQFDDTWGDHPDGGLWRWIGAKADNATRGGDQKPGACCLPDGTCQDLERAECDERQGAFNEGIDCASGICDSPECQAADCDTFVECQGDPNCGCIRLSGGGAGGVCVQNVSCEPLTPCPNGVSDCAPGEVCAIDTCCSGNVCVPPEAFCPDRGVPIDPPPPGTLTLFDEQE